MFVVGYCVGGGPLPPVFCEDNLVGLVAKT